MHILLLILLLVVFATVLRYIFKHHLRPPARKRNSPISPSPADQGIREPPQESQPAWPPANVPIPPNPSGKHFDEASIYRRRADITTEKPTKLLGRVCEIRYWEDEARLFAHKKSMISFHLYYDRAFNDYGNLRVKLRRSYFKTLKLQDGDELEMDLKWKRPWQYGCVSCIKNISSGQRVAPKSSKAGTVEGSKLEPRGEL